MPVGPSAPLQKRMQFDDGTDRKSRLQVTLGHRSWGTREEVEWSRPVGTNDQDVPSRGGGDS